jgi:hypothetical protein
MAIPGPLDRFLRMWCGRCQDPFHTLSCGEAMRCRTFRVVHPPRPGEEQGQVCWYPLRALCRWAREGRGSGPPRDPLTRRPWSWAELWRLCVLAQRAGEEPAMAYLFFERWFFGDQHLPPQLCQASGANLKVLSLQARLRRFRLPLYWSLPPFMATPLASCHIDERLRVAEVLIALDHDVLVWEMVRMLDLHMYEKYVDVEFWWPPFLANLMDIAVNYHAIRCVRKFLENDIGPVYGLHLACMRGQVELAQLLLSHDNSDRLVRRRAPYTVTGNTKAPFAAPTHAYSWETYWTPLQCAMSSINAPHLLALFHEHGEPHHAPTENGESLFCIALYYGHLSLLPSLVKLYGFGTAEECALLAQEHIRTMLAGVEALRGGPALRWTNGRGGEVWLWVLRCYLQDPEEVPIWDLLRLVHVLRTTFHNTELPAVADRYISNNICDGSWLAALIEPDLVRRSRLAFLSHFLHAWDCSLPAAHVPPMQWTALPAPLLRPSTELWERLWQCQTTVLPWQRRLKPALLGKDVLVLLLGGQQRRSVLHRGEELLEQLCAAALHLARLDPERLCEQITPSVQAPLTPLQHIIVSEVLLRIHGETNPALPLLLECPPAAGVAAGVAVAGGLSVSSKS